MQAARIALGCLYVILAVVYAWANSPVAAAFAFAAICWWITAVMGAEQSQS